MSPKRTRNEHTWNETRWHLKQRKCIVVRGLQDQIPWSCVENEPWRVQEEPCYNSDRATFMMTISSFWSLNASQQCLVAWCLWFVEAIFGAFLNHQNIAIMPPVLHFNLVYGCIYGMYMGCILDVYVESNLPVPDKTSHRLFIKVPASQDLTWQHRVHGKACCRCFWKTITTHPRFGSLELKVSQDDMEFLKKCHPLLQRRCLMSFMWSHNSSRDKQNPKVHSVSRDPAFVVRFSVWDNSGSSMMPLVCQSNIATSQLEQISLMCASPLLESWGDQLFKRLCNIMIRATQSSSGSGAKHWYYSYYRIHKSSKFGHHVFLLRLTESLWSGPLFFLDQDMRYVANAKIQQCWIYKHIDIIDIK